MDVEIETAQAFAADAAEAIRRLNHATLMHAQAPLVPEVYTIAADLASMAHRLNQACSQLSTALRVRLDHGGLAADDGTDPGTSVIDAQVALRQAGDLAHALGRTFERTQSLIAIISDGA